MRAWSALLLVACTAAGASGLPQWQEPVTGMQFVAVPKGCFRMGAATPLRPKDDPIWEELGYRGHLAADALPRHEVCVDRFWLARHEVRADQWQQVMDSPPPAGRGAEPAAGMSWDEAKRFAKRLGERVGERFRLPTEAEWEYACRAGAASEAEPEHGKRIESAWYNPWSGVFGHPALKPTEVGRLAPNRWGLHDMLGNVWEWTEDSYRVDAYSRHMLYNPVERSGSARVIRGASHRSDALQVRCSMRGSHPAGAGMSQIGLRLVREVRIEREAK